MSCLAWWCTFRLYWFAAFLHNFERLAGLKCSIVQCRVQPDGSYLAILTTTSSIGQQIRVWNGFGSMYRVSGIQSPRTPWDRPRRTQPPIGNGARSITSKCIGLGKARAALFHNRYPMQPSILGITGTGSPGDTNVWVVHDPASRGQFSLQVHRTSCMLD